MPSINGLPAAEAAKFICIDCHRNTMVLGEYYMVHETVWKKAHPGMKGMLCVSCLEKRLQRQLVAADFTHYPINDISRQRNAGCSPLLMSRLTAR